MDRVIYVPYNVINAVGKDQIKDNIKQGYYGCTSFSAADARGCNYLHCNDCIMFPGNYRYPGEYTIEVYYPPKE